MVVLTRQEKAVLYFLLAFLLVGGLVNVYRRRALENKTRDPAAEAFLRQFRQLSEAPARAPVGVGRDTTGEDTPALLKLDLNAASAEDLQRLPRVGPVMAQRIIAYREQKGGFRRVEELLKIKGIGEKTLAKLRPHLYIRESK